MPPGTLDAINAAAGQNDRWLFVALLCVFGCAIWLVSRYFIRLHERTEKKMGDLEKFVREELIGALSRTEVQLAENAAAMRECRDALKHTQPLPPPIHHPHPISPLHPKGH